MILKKLSFVRIPLQENIFSYEIYIHIFQEEIKHLWIKLESWTNKMTTNHHIPLTNKQMEG